MEVAIRVLGIPRVDDRDIETLRSMVNPTVNFSGNNPTIRLNSDIFV